MSSTKDIKQRIANIRSVEQIIKAMEMVASTKLVKARRQLEGVRPIYQELKSIVEEVGNLKDAQKHTFYKEREVKNSLYIIVTSDRGLAGSYNANVMTQALRHMEEKKEKLIVVGFKGCDYFNKKGKDVIRQIIDVRDANVYYGCENLANTAIDLYLSDQVQEVFIVYTHFKNVLSYEPVIQKILPIIGQVVEEKDYSTRKYEPNIETYIEETIPLYLHMKLFRAFSESHTSEQAARMVNMDAAGKNASEIIEDLTSMYNRKRQAAITQEISEIVGSANIMNKGGLDG